MSNYLNHVLLIKQDVIIYILKLEEIVDKEKEREKLQRTVTTVSPAPALLHNEEQSAEHNEEPIDFLAQLETEERSAQPPAPKVTRTAAEEEDVCHHILSNN
jgi:hypothetical protein